MKLVKLIYLSNTYNFDSNRIRVSSNYVKLNFDSFNIDSTPLLELIRDELGGWELVNIPETKPFSFSELADYHIYQPSSISSITSINKAFFGFVIAINNTNSTLPNMFVSDHSRCTTN